MKKKKKKRGTVVKVNYMDREYNYNIHACIALERRSPEQVYIYMLASRVNETCYFDKYELLIISSNDMI
jgi:hypothetical protein